MSVILLLRDSEKTVRGVCGCVCDLCVWFDFNEIVHTWSTAQNVGRVEVEEKI